MKKQSLILWLALSLAASVRADEKIAAAQRQLAAQGLYRGPADGTINPELTAAFRRYQIRAGLEVTGQLNDATVQALQAEGTASSASNPTSGLPPLATPSPAAMPAAPSPTPADSTGDDRTRVTQFLKDYLRAGEGNEIPPQLNFFTFPATYFQHGRVSAEFVAKDTAGYVRRWPERHYLLIEPVVLQRLSPAEVMVDFTIAYEVKNAQKTARGRSSNRFILHEENGQFHIASLQEKLLKD